MLKKKVGKGLRGGLGVLRGGGAAHLWLEDINILFLYKFHDVEKSQLVDSISAMAVQGSELIWNSRWRVEPFSTQEMLFIIHLVRSVNINTSTDVFHHII